MPAVSLSLDPVQLSVAVVRQRFLAQLSPLERARWRYWWRRSRQTRRRNNVQAKRRTARWTGIN